MASMSPFDLATFPSKVAALLGRGDYEKAERYLLEVLADEVTARQRLLGMLLLGTVYHLQGKYDAELAIQEERDGVLIASGSSEREREENRLGVARTLAYLGRAEESTAAAEGLRTSQDSDIRHGATTVMGIAAARNGNTREAAVWLMDSSRHSPKRAPLLTLVWELVGSNKELDACNEYVGYVEQWLRENPEVARPTELSDLGALQQSLRDAGSVSKR
jgi:hypothetical protein